MDKEDWHASVHGVTESRTQLTTEQQKHKYIRFCGGFFCLFFLQFSNSLSDRNTKTWQMAQKTVKTHMNLTYEYKNTNRQKYTFKNTPTPIRIHFRNAIMV